MYYMLPHSFSIFPSKVGVRDKSHMARPNSAQREGAWDMAVEQFVVWTVE